MIFYVPYPKSLTQANLFQILIFFIPLFLSLSFTFDLILNLSLVSYILSLGLILLLILKSLDALNLVTAVLTLLAVYLFLSYFKNGGKKSKLKSLRRLNLE